jgi:hypothetical protein
MLRIPLLLLGFVLLGVVPTAAQTVGPILDPASGHRYYFDPGSYTWSDAQSWAVSRGGHLASLGGSAENAWVRSQLPAGSDWYWIGAQDDANTTDDVFVWLSGEPWFYRNFAPGEPDDQTAFGGQGDYLAMNRTTGEWNDVQGFIPFAGGVAEVVPSLQTSPAVHDFGNVAVSAPPAPAMLTITNAGSSTTISSLTAVSGCGEFTVTPGQALPVVLGNNEQLTVNVTYDPVNRVADVCSYTIDGPGGVLGFFELRGDGIAPVLDVVQSQLVFADQVWSSPTHETLNVTVGNTGDAPFALANLGRVLMTGTEFSLGTPSGTFPVGPGEMVTIPVTFDPTSVGAKSDVLTISLNNDAPGDPNRTVSLSGNGTDVTGVEPLISHGIRSLGPSPTSGVLRAAIAFDRAGALEVDVRDVAGRVVARARSLESGAGARTFEFRDGSDWSPASGVYFVRVRFDGGLLGVRKVVVAR